MAINFEENPWVLFENWFSEARKKEGTSKACAMALATIDEYGQPWCRMVLLKTFDTHGFVFYTNLESPKGRQLNKNPRASLCFYWRSLGRQVRVQGTARKVSDTEADAYFATRNRESQIAAWASRQSARLKNQIELDEQVEEVTNRFKGESVPRPPFWSGFRVAPDRIEFWQEENFRLHERLLYARSMRGWDHELLYP